MVLAVNVVPGTLEDLHQRCRDQGLETSFVHHPVYKPTLTSNINSLVVPYAKLEKPSQKFCLVHLPVIEILTGDENARALPQSAALRQELYSLHRYEILNFLTYTNTNLGKQPGYHPVVRLLYRLL